MSYLGRDLEEYVILHFAGSFLPAFSHCGGWRSRFEGTRSNEVLPKGI